MNPSPTVGYTELCDKLECTSKNYPFAIWTHLLHQHFILKIPQYTKYSGIFKTYFGSKFAAKIAKGYF